MTSWVWQNVQGAQTTQTSTPEATETSTTATATFTAPSVPPASSETSLKSVNGSVSSQSSSEGTQKQEADSSIADEPATPSEAGGQQQPKTEIHTAHNVFNSYSTIPPWNAFPPGTVMAQVPVNDPDVKNPAVASKVSVLESELVHLRQALSEKTLLVQELSRQLEAAHETIRKQREALQQLQEQQLQQKEEEEAAENTEAAS